MFDSHSWPASRALGVSVWSLLCWKNFLWLFCMVLYSVISTWIYKQAIMSSTQIWFVCPIKQTNKQQRKILIFFSFELWSLIHKGLTIILFTNSWKCSIIHRNVKIHASDPQNCHMLWNFCFVFLKFVYYVLLHLMVSKPLIISIVLSHLTQI